MISTLGRYALASFRGIGRVSIFIIAGTRCCFVFPIYFKEILRHIVSIGFYSLPIVGLTAIFAGMALALQMHVGFTRFNAEGAIASVVLIGITRELGPVFAGLMVAGRMSSSMAAEIG